MVGEQPTSTEAGNRISGYIQASNSQEGKSQELSKPAIIPGNLFHMKACDRIRSLCKMFSDAGTANYELVSALLNEIDHADAAAGRFKAAS